MHISSCWVREWWGGSGRRIALRLRLSVCHMSYTSRQLFRLFVMASSCLLFLLISLYQYPFVKSTHYCPNPAVEFTWQSHAATWWLFFTRSSIALSNRRKNSALTNKKLQLIYSAWCRLSFEKTKYRQV